MRVRLTRQALIRVMIRENQPNLALVALPPLTSSQWQGSLRTFVWGMRSAGTTVLALVLFATYLGIGALAHDSSFSMGWALASTIFVWAGPAQIILISTLGSGAAAGQAAMP